MFEKFRRPTLNKKMTVIKPSRNLLMRLMLRLARESYLANQSWQCQKCKELVSPQDRTLEEFADACLDHAKGCKKSR